MKRWDLLHVELWLESVKPPAVIAPRLNVRMLFLLVLFQLVAGPLVLVTVLTFCKVVVREGSEQGLPAAVAKAWNCHEVQTLLHAVAGEESPATSKPLGPDKKSKPVEKKITGMAWAGVPWIFAEHEPHRVRQGSRAWTPAWPQAPPGTPPRMG